MNFPEIHTSLAAEAICEAIAHALSDLDDQIGIQKVKLQETRNLRRTFLEEADDWYVWAYANGLVDQRVSPWRE